MNKIALMYHDVYKQSGTESGFQNESAFQYKISEEEFESHVKENPNNFVKKSVKVY